MNVAGYLAELTGEIRSSTLTERCRAAVRQHLLDALACAYVGCRQKSFQDLAGLCPDSAEGSGWPGSYRRRTSVADAAMLWAFAIHASVFEDGSREGACHPSAAVVSVVATLGKNRDWALIERAVVAGYDVMVRLARCGNPLLARRGFHPTAVTAPFGAAATASVLLGHSAATTEHALSIAALGSSGLMSGFKCGETQPLQVAWGVRNGVVAALLAGDQNPGYTRVFEDGFFRAYLGQEPQVPVNAPLEHGYAVIGSYLKPYPGCRHVHPSIEAFGCALAALGVESSERIRAVRVGTYRVAIETEIHDLKSRHDAYFNIPYALAARAVFGTVNYDAFDEKRFSNHKLVALMDKVDVRVDPEVDAQYPAQRGAVVEVETVDGRRLAAKVEHALGEPENPLDPRVTMAKFRDAATPFVGSDAVERVVGICDTSREPVPARELYETLSGIPSDSRGD